MSEVNQAMAENNQGKADSSHDSAETNQRLLHLYELGGECIFALAKIDPLVANSNP